MAGTSKTQSKALEFGLNDMFYFFQQREIKSCVC